MFFMPYGERQRAAVALDTHRLGRMPSEALRILREIKAGGNSPSAKFWRPRQDTLVSWASCYMDELIVRGYLPQKGIKAHLQLFLALEARIKTTPEIGRICLSHRGELVRRDPEYYIPKFYFDVDHFRTMKRTPLYWGE